MSVKKYFNPSLQEVEDKLTELERRIVEENFDSTVEGFEDEFYKLEDKVGRVYHNCYDERETEVVDSFVKRLQIIKEEQDLYDEQGELDMMFPNRKDEDEDVDDIFF